MVLLDTHALLWWVGGSRYLSAKARKEISHADTLLVSPASCWEIAVLVRKQRLSLDRDLFDWVRATFLLERVDLAALTPSAAASAGLLGGAFGGDFVDRLLYATAREMAVPLITRDEAIQALALATGDVRTIW